MKITSPSNPRIKSVISLSSKSERVRTGLIAIEGIREISKALEAHVEFRDVYYCSEIANGDEKAILLERLASTGAQMIEISTRVYSKLAYRKSVCGILAVAERNHRLLSEIPCIGNPLLLVVEHLEKPGNLGAVLRSADGAGATGVIASDERTDLYNPNVIRASLGTIFTMPTVATTAKEAIRWLRSKGVAIIVTTPGADTLYTEADLTGPTAVVVGSEDKGVRQEWFEAADVKVKIPMLGSADSLNVAQSATILAYEALRQRSAIGK